MIKIVVLGFGRKAPYWSNKAGYCRLNSPSSSGTIDVGISLGFICVATSLWELDFDYLEDWKMKWEGW